MARKATIGCALPAVGDEIGQAICEELDTLGCRAIPFLYDQELPAGLDLLVIYGPYTSLYPVIGRWQALAPGERPRLALWQTESLPDPRLPEWFRRSLGSLRSRMDRCAYLDEQAGNRRWRAGLARMLQSGFRYRYYGDMLWLQDKRILNVLAVTSSWNADYLNARGIQAITAYGGSYPKMGDDLQIERDIPVLWIGKAGSRRRKKLLDDTRQQLLQRGVEVMVVDGEENPYVFGEQRTMLFNRTRIVLNLVRQEWDDNSMRFYLAARNKALIVSEPILPHTPFEHGRHLLVAPVNRLADTICTALASGTQNREIVEQAYRLVTSELTMRNSLHKILHRAGVMG